MIVAILGGSFSAIAGCVPYSDTFRHMSFEDSPGVEVVRYGTPELDGLIDVSDFPVEYTLSRGDYHMNLDVSGYRPSVRVRVQSGNSYQRIGIRLLDEQGASCATSGGANNEAKTSYTLSAGGNCENGSLVVNVEDASGSTVHFEQIPFRIVTNGRFCVWDGL